MDERCSVRGVHRIVRLARTVQQPPHHALMIQVFQHHWRDLRTRNTGDRRRLLTRYLVEWMVSWSYFER